MEYLSPGHYLASIQGLLRGSGEEGLDILDGVVFPVMPYNYIAVWVVGLTTNTGSVGSSCATSPVPVSSDFSSTPSTVLVLIAWVIAREGIIIVSIEVITGHGILTRERGKEREREREKYCTNY